MNIDTLRERLAHIESTLAAACAKSGRSRSDVRLVAVTKTTSVEVASLLPSLGVNDLGESRPQELWKKAEAIPSACWHFIGHLQRNKVERTIPLCSLIHSVDTERLAQAISALGRTVPVLLEVNCSREEAKGGFPPETLPEVAERIAALPGLDWQGLMTMAAHSENPEDCRGTFAELRALRDDLRRRTGKPLPHLSMGMSNDYAVAVEEGATLIRLGSILFANLE